MRRAEWCGLHIRKASFWRRFFFPFFTVSRRLRTIPFYCHNILLDHLQDSHFFLSPFSISPSTSVFEILGVSAITVFRVVIGPAQLADEPTARNSNLLPVKANGDVRFLVGIVQHQFGDASVDIQFEDCFILFIKITAYALFDLVQYVGQVFPMKIEIMAGGASLAPRR